MGHFWLIWTGLGLSTPNLESLYLWSHCRESWHEHDTILTLKAKKGDQMWTYVPVLQVKVLILFSVMCRVKKKNKKQKTPALENQGWILIKRGGPWAEPWWSDAMEEEREVNTAEGLKQKYSHFLMTLRANEFSIFPQPQFLSEERAVMLPHMVSWCVCKFYVQMLSFSHSLPKTTPQVPRGSLSSGLLVVPIFPCGLKMCVRLSLGCCEGWIIKIP